MLLHNINSRDITNMAEPRDEHNESICGAEKRDRQILSTDDAQNILSTLRTQECLLIHSQNVMYTLVPETCLSSRVIHICYHT